MFQIRRLCFLVVVVVGRGATNETEPFLEWLMQISNTANPPLVHSISYADDEEELPEPYMNRLNVEFMKAGLRGLTFLFAAGDDGTHMHSAQSKLPLLFVYVVFVCVVCIWNRHFQVCLLNLQFSFFCIGVCQIMCSVSSSR